jgi:phosphoribosylaminoimidazole carboxylase (NCAIR synthetase)
LDILQRVNHRRFLFEVVEPSDNRRWIDVGQDLRWLEHSPRRGLRLKRAYGFAGRGQRVIRGEPSADDRRWIRDSLNHGLLVEPELEVRRELTIHGLLVGHRKWLGRPCVQRCDRWGRVEGIELASVHDAARSALVEHAECVAERLRAAGYFGPFGLDFLVSESGPGECGQLSEINARMSLGWSMGMAEHREAALRSLHE